MTIAETMPANDNRIGDRAATLAVLKERFGERYSAGLPLRQQHAHTEDRNRAHQWTFHRPTFSLQSVMFRLADGDQRVAIV